MVLRYLMTRTWMSVLGVVLAVVVAIPTYIYLGHRLLCHSMNVREGADIDHACLLVAFSGAVLPIMFYEARKKGHAFAVILLLEAVVLGIAIALVAADSATHVATWNGIPCADTVSPPHTEVHHVERLYAVLGVPLVFLLFRGFGAWQGAGVVKLNRFW